jgi:dTDP-4-dehydrorhamnose reductase
MSISIKDSPILVIGSAGQVASSLRAMNDDRLIFVGRPEFDVQKQDDIKRAFDKLLPALVINCSAYTAVDLAEQEIEAAYNLNSLAVKNLSLECLANKIPLIHISTDYVFDGTLDRPYRESDGPNPLSVYSKSKLNGEEIIKEILSKYIIIRSSWIFSEYGTNFVKTMLKLAETKEEISVVNDQMGSPTSASNIASAIHQIANKIIESPDTVNYGIYNYTDSPTVSWYEFACEIFKIMQTLVNKKAPILKPIPSSEYKSVVKRPLNSRLDCSLIKSIFGIESRDWHSELERIIEKIIIDKGL